MQVAVSLLGGFAVAADGNVVPDREGRSRRARQLVALLALAPNRRLTTEQVMDALWPDLLPDAARANLHKTATLARQALGSREAVVLRGDVVSLWPSADVRVDALELERQARNALASANPRTSSEVAGRLAGELLPDERYEEWAVTPRERLRALYLDLLRAAGDWGSLAEEDPTDEAAHRGLMKEHLEAGRLHAAIRQFQRLRTILARELGVLPSPETVALYREIVGTAQSGWVRPGLVGREVELVRARATLRRAVEGRPAATFVTGPSGIGKTRLCEELVEQATGEGWFVLRGAGREQTASVPYWPLVEAVNAAMVERPGLAESLPGPERALLARLSGLTADHPQEPVHRHAVSTWCRASWPPPARRGRCSSWTTSSSPTTTPSLSPRCWPAPQYREERSSSPPTGRTTGVPRRSLGPWSPAAWAWRSSSVRSTVRRATRWSSTSSTARSHPAISTSPGTWAKGIPFSPWRSPPPSAPTSRPRRAEPRGRSTSGWNGFRPTPVARSARWRSWPTSSPPTSSPLWPPSTVTGRSSISTLPCRSASWRARAAATASGTTWCANG